MSSELVELATRCIRCGFCLESCPTFIETGLETLSPRGRIYLARSAEEGRIAWTLAREALDSCLGCRACETACPSGVEYGRLLELARARQERVDPDPRLARLLDRMTRPSWMRLAVTAGGLLPDREAPNLLGPGTIAVPEAQPAHDWPPYDGPHPDRGQVALLSGCAMEVLFARAHEASARLLARVGLRARPLRGCCGALHAHNGFLEQGRRLARVLESDGLTVVTDSAGCGSWLKETLDAPVRDIAEVLLEEGLASSLARCEPLRVRVAYHDACHLAHAQGIRTPPRALLAAIPGLEMIPLAEADTCCGSAGIYSLRQPDMARRLLERKWHHIVASGADVVVAGNPGCLAWLAVAARGSHIRVMHTVEVLESAFSGWFS